MISNRPLADESTRGLLPSALPRQKRLDDESAKLQRLVRRRSVAGQGDVAGCAFNGAPHVYVMLRREGRRDDRKRVERVYRQAEARYERAIFRTGYL